MRDVPELTKEDLEEDTIHNGDEVVPIPAPMLEKNPLVQEVLGPADPGGNSIGEDNKERTETPKPTQQQKFPKHPTSDTQNGSFPEEIVDEGPIESINEVNDHLSRPDKSSDIGGSCVKEIVAHDWRLGQPHFKVGWSSGDVTWEHIRDMREDYPRLTAQYIVGHNVTRSKRGGDRVLLWAKKVVRDLNRSIRRITRLYDLYLDDHDEVNMIRRVQKGSKRKRKKFSLAPRYKYGFEVPHNYYHAKKLDKRNNNNKWQDCNTIETDQLDE